MGLNQIFKKFFPKKIFFKKNVQRKQIIYIFAASNLNIITIMTSKTMKINELAKEAFRKMVMEGMIRGLALATTKGVTTKNVLDVNNAVDELLRKWRGEL